MIGRLERKAEVIHGEDVFQKLRFLKITNAPGLSCGIEFVGCGVGFDVEVVVIARLVDAHTPQDDRRMIPVAANHAADVVDRDLLPLFIANMLPAGDFLEDQQAELVTSVEKIR